MVKSDNDNNLPQPLLASKFETDFETDLTTLKNCQISNLRPGLVRLQPNQLQ